MMINNRPVIDHKIKSSTLLEIMMALTISAIVIIVIILAYSIINKQFINFHKQSEQINNIHQLFNTLENDLHTHCLERFSPDSLIIGNFKKKLYYLHNDYAIWRSTGQKTDTLLRGTQQLEFRYPENHTDKKIIELVLYFPKDTLVYSGEYLEY